MRRRNVYLRKKYSSKRYRLNRNMRKVEKIAVCVVAVIVLIFSVLLIRDFVFIPKKRISIPEENVAAFQIPQRTMVELKVLSEKYMIDYAELLTVYSLENNFFPTKKEAPSMEELEQNFIRNYDKIKKEYSRNTINIYYEMFDALLSEIEYFPIALEYDESSIYDIEDSSSYMYGDSWGVYNVMGSGDNLYEGTDIYDRENIPGRLPILSITDGTVERIGWDKVSGYTVEIKTNKNSIYYYSHLDSFAENLKQGTKVQGGQLIGYMGNSGMSQKDDENNSTQVHLHVGISPEVSFSGDRFWINPYPFLRLIELNKYEYLLPKYESSDDIEYSVPFDSNGHKDSTPYYEDDN